MPKYWFRQKTFGYGAAPNTWQGWVFTFVLLIVIAALALIADFIRDNSLRLAWLVGGLAAVMIPSLIVAHRKTEGGWRWRGGRHG